MFDEVRLFGEALPDDEGAPALTAQFGADTLVARNVLRELTRPELDPASRHASPRASGVAVPEAPMNEDGALKSSNHDVRSARDVPGMKPIAKT